MTERTPEESLAEAVRIHDDDPWAARELMLSLAGRLSAPGDLARLAWLATHVLGGLLKRWPEALQVCRQAVTAAGPPRPDMLRSLAASATLAGDVLEAAEAEAALAALFGAPVADCTTLARLLVIEQDLSQDKLARWLPLLDDAVARAEAIDGPPDLVRFLAITANNSASAILDWIPAATGETASVLERTARLSFRCWLAVGSWVHHERAHYLMALALNTTGRSTAAADHARQGLALIRANEPQPVDSCFHLLALARALNSLGDTAGADAALAEAATYPAGFDDYWRAEYEKIRGAL
jgi:ATP/maltotriose-dependent transcriptional regulator MalT